MTKQDLLQLPGTIEYFNGIYTRHWQTIMVNETSVLIIDAVAVSSIFAIMGKIAFHVLKRR